MVLDVNDADGITLAQDGEVPVEHLLYRHTDVSVEDASGTPSQRAWSVGEPSTRSSRRQASTLRYADEMPAVVNDPRLIRRTLETASRTLSAESGRLLPDPPMTDDFALFAERAPAVYFKLGVADPAAASWPPLHSGGFDVDEHCIGTGVTVMTELARDLLTRGDHADATT